MRFQWSVPARNDVVRLHQFLADKNEAAAANVVRSLINAPATLLLNPRRGEKIEGLNLAKCGAPSSAAMKCIMSCRMMY